MCLAPCFSKLTWPWQSIDEKYCDYYVNDSLYGNTVNGIAQWHSAFFILQKSGECSKVYIGVKLFLNLFALIKKPRIIKWVILKEQGLDTFTNFPEFRSILEPDITQKFLQVLLFTMVKFQGLDGHRIKLTRFTFYGYLVLLKRTLNNDIWTYKWLSVKWAWHYDNMLET